MKKNPPRRRPTSIGWIAAALCCGGCATDLSAPTVCDTAKSNAIQHATPLENSQVDATGVLIGANVRPPRRPAAPSSRLRLSLDGIDVTRQTRVTDLRDAADISFVPFRPLPAGKHVVEVRFDDTNDRQCYRWVFYVRDLG